MTKEKTLTLIGSLINGTSEAFGLGHAQLHKGRIKGDDPEIDTTQTPKRFSGRLAPLEKIRKTFTDSISNKLTVFFLQIMVVLLRLQL